MAGATVTVYGWRSEDPAPADVHAFMRGSVSSKARADAEGRARFKNVAVGPVLVVASVQRTGPWDPVVARVRAEVADNIEHAVTVTVPNQ